MARYFYVISRPDRAAYELGTGRWAAVAPADLPQSALDQFTDGEAMAAELRAFFARHGARGIEVVDDRSLPWNTEDGWMLEGAGESPAAGCPGLFPQALGPLSD